MPYAKRTTVPVHQSKGQIETLLRKHGAIQFNFAHDTIRNVIGLQFQFTARAYRFIVPMPSADKLRISPGGRTRTDLQVIEQMDQEERRVWRALLLIIKAKMEAVESGIETFEEAFLAQTVLPGSNAVLGKDIQPLIEQAYETQDSSVIQDNLLPAL